MPHCQCGAFVSHDWKRVLAGDNGVESCPACAPRNGSGDYHEAHGTHKLSVR